MTLLEFTRSRFCKPLVLPEEDCPQDVNEWRRLVREDQERQYRDFLGSNGESNVEKTDEERRVERFLAEKNLPVPVEAEPDTERVVRHARGSEARETTVTDNGKLAGVGKTRGGQKFDKVAYQREYMRKWRAKRNE